MIALVCTLEPYRIAWLPQFVHHYRSIGVERFLLTLQLDPSVPERERIREQDRFFATLSTLGITAGYRWDHEWNAPTAIRNEWRLVEENVSAPDWVVWCDSDEFQVYPAPLSEIIRENEAQKVDYLRGLLVDRVAADYRLAAFDADTPLWNTFPATVDVTLALARGDPRKVVLTRASVRVFGGKHAPVDSQRLKTISGWVQVHHFKWDARLLDRLRFRVRPEWQARFPWWVESQRLLDYFAAHDSRFDPRDLKPIKLTGPQLMTFA